MTTTTSVSSKRSGPAEPLARVLRVLSSIPLLIAPQLRKETRYGNGERDQSMRHWFRQYKKVPANGVVKIICGEFRNIFTEKGKMIETTTALLEKGVSIYVISGVETDNYKGSVEAFKEAHPNWWGLILKHPNLHFYRLDVRPPRHYSIFNDTVVYIEEAHPPISEKETLFRQDSNLAKDLEERFDNHLKEVENYRLPNPNILAN